MPRQARLDAPGALHHVMGRGIEGTSIFRTNKDREDFLTRLGALYEGELLSIHAWALLDNHFHLLIRTGKQCPASIASAFGLILPISSLSVKLHFSLCGVLTASLIRQIAPSADAS